MQTIDHVTVSVTQGQLFTDNDAPWNAMMARPLPPAPGAERNRMTARRLPRAADRSRYREFGAPAINV